MIIHKKIILLILLFFTISCSNNKVVNNHGFNALEIKADKIKVDESNKNDVLNNIGNPSSVSLFDDNTWFFLQRNSLNQSVFKLGKSKIQKNNVLEVTFDKYGIVKTKKFYKIENMNSIKVAKETTKNTYQNNSYFEKLLKSVKQKVESPKTNRKRR